MKRTPIRKVSEKTKLLNERYRKLWNYLLVHRAFNLCERCGSSSILSVHHIVFRSHGRIDTKENLIILCQDCHDKAGASLISKEELFAIVKERNDSTVQD